MEIQNQTDTEILHIAEMMYTEIIEGSNAQDWGRFSQFMEEDKKRNQHTKANVLKQWENIPALTSLTQKRELLGILRRDDHVLITWRQWSAKVKDEHLALLYLKSVEEEVKTIGIFLK